MIEWGSENGIEWNSKLKCYDFADTGRGVITNDDIKENEVLIQVPEKYLIHSRSKFSLSYLNLPESSGGASEDLSAPVDQNEFYKPFHNCLRNLNSKQRISLLLIVEKLIKSHSIWDRYLDELPKDYSITSTYSDKEIESLAYSYYFETSKKLKDEMLNSFKVFCQVFQSNYGTDLDRIIINVNQDIQVKLGNILDKDLYIWCWGTIQTRTYYYNQNIKNHQINNSNSNNNNNNNNSNLEDDKDNYTLIPLADLFNHNSNVETEAMFNAKLNCYQVKTKTAFSKGSQVFISYGKHSNFTLMNYYGFIIQDNDQDSIPLIQSECIPSNLILNSTSTTSTTNSPTSTTIIIPDEIKLYEKKINILNQYGLSIYGDGKFLVMQDDKLPFSWNYLTVLKVLFMTKDEISNQLELNLFHYDEPISSSNELQVLQYLNNFTNTQLSLFKNIQTNLSANNIDRYEINYLISSNIKIWESCDNWIQLQLQQINNTKKDKSTNNNNNNNNKKSTNKKSITKKK